MNQTQEGKKGSNNNNKAPLPTNTWYQNLLRFSPDETTPSSDNRAYPIPYVIDVSGTIPGLRVHSPRLVAASTQVTVTVDEPYGLTLGAAVLDNNGGLRRHHRRRLDSSSSKGYTATHASDLSVTLQWEAYSRGVQHDA